MVKIPDIEDFNPRRDFGVDRDVRVTPTRANISNAGAPGAAVAGLGRAISGVGSDLQGIADKQKAEQEQLNAFNATTGFYNTTGAVNRELDERMKSAPADGSGVDKMFGEVFDKNFGAYLAGITDQKLRARKEADVAQARAQYEARGRSTMEGLRTNHYTGEINRFGTSAVNGLQQKPDAWDATNAGLGQLIAQSGLPPEAKSRIVEQWEPKLIQGRIDGYHRLADQAEREGRLDDATALRAKASTFATEMDRQQAARAGVPLPAVTGRPQAASSKAGVVDPRAVYGMAKAEVEKQGLVGIVPVDGPKYGITTGSADEWARYFTGLAKHESGLKNSTVGDVHDFEGGSRGLFQLSYHDAQTYGLNGGKPFTPEQLADPTQNTAAAVAITKTLVTKAGSIRGGAGKYWGPITRENWTPGNGRDRDLPWAELGGEPAGTGTYATYSTALSQQSEARLRQEQVRIRTADKERHDAYVNQIEFGIHDGTYGIANLVQDRQNGVITDAGEYVKLEKLIEDRQGETNILADAIDKIDGQNKAYAFDPMDKDDKKAVEAYSQAYKLGEGIGKQDPSVVNRAVNVVDRTGMIPRDVVGPLQAKFRSTDVGAFTFGMQAMQALYQRSPDVFAKTFGEKVTQSVATWGELAPYRSAQESFDLIKKDSDPAAAAQKEKLLKEADKAMNDAPITAADLPAIFYGNTDYEGPASKDLGPWDKDRWAGGPPMAPAQSAQLQFDYAKLYRENYALAQGDVDVAKKTTIQQMQRMWGETRIHGAGGSSAWGVFGLRDRVVKYPPERFYPPVDGSYDWIKGAVEDAVKGNAGAVADWELLPVPETAVDVKAGSAPRYGIMVKNDAGVWSELRDQSNQPLLIDFDPKASRRAGQDKAQQEAAAAAGRQAAAGDANRNLYQAGGNPFALMPQEQVAPGPEVNAAMQRRFGPKGGVGSAKIPE